MAKKIEAIVGVVLTFLIINWFAFGLTFSEIIDEAKSFVGLGVSDELTESKDYAIRDTQSAPGDFGVPVITGVFENQSGQDLSGLTITFELLDRRDQVVGTTMARKARLDEGTQWQFESLPIGTEHAAFEIESVSVE